MKTYYLLLGIILLTLPSCSNSQDLETKLFKITPGMTKQKVLSVVGKPKYVGQEQGRDGVVEVWHYPNQAPRNVVFRDEVVLTIRRSSDE